MPEAWHVPKGSSNCSWQRTPATRSILEALDLAVRQAVAEVVRKQAEAGVTIVSDGEQSKVGFAAYVTGRVNGFDGPELPRPVTLDARQFPDYAGRQQTMRPACTSPISWKDFAPVEKDIANLKAALQGVAVEEAFMPAASPGTIANWHPNHYYGSREYLSAIADVMKREYEAIAAAGFIVQIDRPDLALHNTWFPDLTLEQFRHEAAMNVEAMNHATRDIPLEQVRFHVCWGSGEGPHNHDPELKDLVDFLVKGRAAAMSIVSANARHEHEWKVWKDVKLPDGMVLIPALLTTQPTSSSIPRSWRTGSCAGQTCLGARTSLPGSIAALAQPSAASRQRLLRPSPGPNFSRWVRAPAWRASSSGAEGGN